MRVAEGPLRRVLAGRPRRLTELLSDPDPAAARRVMQAMLGMRKIEIPELERAVAGREIGAD